jgi:hypothetical protein
LACQVSSSYQQTKLRISNQCSSPQALFAIGTKGPGIFTRPAQDEPTGWGDNKVFVTPTSAGGCVPPRHHKVDHAKTGKRGKADGAPTQPVEHPMVLSDRLDVNTSHPDWADWFAPSPA